MKLHRHLVESVITALESIFESKFYADKVIEKTLKNQRKWGARDRRYFAETVYDIVRWYRLLSELAGGDDYWGMWAIHSLRQGLTLPEWAEELNLTPKELDRRLKQITNPAILESIPDWLQIRGIEELGAAWFDVLKALNKQAPVYLRTNELKINPTQLVSQLAEEEIFCEPVMDHANYPSALKLKERKNVFASKAFKAGLFEVQDAGSQRIAPLLDVAPGMRVVDACAGAGGKSLHLAALMKNKGKIIAMDIHEWKLKELKTRAARGGVDIIETRVIDSNKVIKRLESSFDRVLLDVPCSGLGVLRRNPDTKWKLSAEELKRLQKLQQEIIRDYSKMCKVGGKMVYATCSVLPSENQEQVQAFLKDHPQWELVSELTLRPDLEDTDGFYAAQLIRKS
ncbi:MAG: methyltransferase domain-containing protein [Bdellovibrionia bacterium]